MLGKLVRFFVGLATVVAGLYAVAAYHFPNDRKAEGENFTQASPAQVRPPTSGGGQTINQTSSGTNSSNIIGNGNVINGR